MTPAAPAADVYHRRIGIAGSPIPRKRSTSMMNGAKTLFALGIGLALGRTVAADEPPTGSTPPPVPVTREDMKKALEASKRNVPRLPLPDPTEEEKARAEESAKLRAAEAAKAGQADRAGQAMGGGIVNNGRMRNLYLSDYGPARPGNAGGRTAQGAPGVATDSTLGYPFQTMLFWITSRGNNCTYCMGHQEVKLASAGLTDDQIAALDGDWSEFPEKERAAFAFTKKLTYEPNAIGDADIAALRRHYNDAQVTEILLAVSGFNATNRWTGALRIPQEDHRNFLKPTSEKYATAATCVAPVGASKSGGLVAPAPRRRPALETRAEVEAALEAARTRTPRLPLADESATKAALGEQAGESPPQWMRLLGVRPNSGPGRATSTLAAEAKGTLDPKTKAIVAWVSARNDRAWYALGHARGRLKALGLTDDQVFALDDPEKLESPADREVARFAGKLAVDPALVADDDIARLRKLFDDKKVAEIVHQGTQAAFFDRLTEAAGLRLEK